jgi:hypothetical protein
MEAKEKQKNRWKTQRRLNWMSWNSNHSVGWTDAIIFTFVGWVLQPENSKETVGWTDGIGSGSAPDDPTSWPAAYPTVEFKSYRDAPRFLLQHRMNRRLMINPVVHPTSIFKLHSTTQTGCSSAPDGPTRCRCIASVNWLGHVVQWLYWILWVTRWSDACVGGTIGSSNGTTFFRKPFPTTSLPC